MEPEEDMYVRSHSVLLGPFTVTLSSPLPAPLVYTLKSATSFTLKPFGWRPLPDALQAFGLQAARTEEKIEDSG